MRIVNIGEAVILMRQSDDMCDRGDTPIEPTLSDTEIGVIPWLAA